MISIELKQVGRAKPWRASGAALAALGWLAMGLSATAQVSVATIGGGVRVECGSASGFVGGNTYDTAQFNGPYSCALDTNGNLWIGDKTNACIEQVTQAGNKADSYTIEYYAISGTSPHFTTNFHPMTNIVGVAVDPGNNLYALLGLPSQAVQVVQYSLSAQTPTLNTNYALFLTNTPANAFPSAVAVDGASNVFLAFTNGVIVQFPFTNRPASIQTNVPYSNTVRYVVASGFRWQPAGLALRADGSLAVSDTLSNAVYVVATNAFNNSGSATNSPRLLTGGNGAGYDEGSPAFAQFDQPRGLAAAADGSLIVCDTMNNRLRAVDTNGNTTWLYGTASNVWPTTCCDCDPALYAGWVDGVAGLASNNASGRLPVSVAISPASALFVTELYYNLIRTVANTSYLPVNLNGTAATATTESATAVTSTNATLNGAVTGGNEVTSYYFEYGLTTNYGTFTATNVLTTNLTISQQVSLAVGNLTPGTMYYYQLVAFNGFGAGYGGNVSLLTPAQSPVVTTLAAINITSSNATLQASVNPEYSQTEVTFQWGTTTNFGNNTPLISLTSNLTSYQTVSSTISNLQSGTIYYFLVMAYNSGGTAIGNELVFNTPYLPPPTLSFSPSSGYFPNCVTIYVTSSVPVVYYTTDGSTPTTNSTEVFLTNSVGEGTNVGSFEWCNSQQSLSTLQLLAGSGSSTTLLQGGYPPTNSVGFPQPLSAGPGDHLYIPVVVNLQSNTALESLQFRVEITPNPPNTNTITSIALQPLTPNDFVPLPGPAPGDAPVNFTNYPYTVGTTEGSVITAEGGAGMNMQASGVAVMLHFTVPNTATYGQSYSLNVLDPSGTSDAQQANVGLQPLPAQTLSISYNPYMVGDSSPSTGYNAGQFGIKGTEGSVIEVGLENADVNNAIYASAGIRVPPNDSDAFNDMDAYPPDSAGHGGDGVIGFNDWQTILGRSLGVSLYLGMDTNNYLRFWTNGDTTYRSHSLFTNWIAGGSPVPLSLDLDSDFIVGGPTKLSLSNAPPGLVWFCEASVGSGVVTQAIPGITYSLPVYVNVLPGYSLAGMQFRAIVTGSSGAPAVSSIQFNRAGSVPNPLVLAGLSGNDKIQAWSFGSFSTAMQNSNYLGTISFQVPSGAYPGACYALHFSGVDGAPDFSIDYQMESHPGYVWVMSAAQQPASITSDEWKIAFFGSLTNSQAGDDVDADGDGALNWQEYLAGTNPTNSLSYLQFSSANLSTTGVREAAINWLTAPGKTYILQSSPALNSGNWTPLNTNSGDGNPYQCIVTNLGGNARFFQILLQP